MRIRWLLAALVAVLLAVLVGAAPAAGPAVAQAEEPAALGDKPRPEHGCAETPGYFRLGGERVLEIRRAPGARGLEEYVRRSSARLQVMAEDRGIPVEAIQVQENPPYSVIGLQRGERFTPELAVDDLQAACFGISRQELAERYRDQLRVAIRRFREVHTLGSWLRGTALAALVLGIYTLLMRAEATLNRRWHRRIDSRSSFLLQYLGRIGGGSRLFDLEQVRSGMQYLRRLLHWFVVVLLTYALIPLVLGFLPPTRGIASGLRRQILVLVSNFAQGIVQAIPDLILVGVIAWITVLLIRASNAWFRALDSGRIQIPGFYEEWALPTSRLVAILLSLVGLVSAFPYIPGAGSRVFQGAGLFVGVLAALGSSAVATNVISGLMLIYTRAFREGDRVEINGTVGVVQDRTLLVTRLQTPRNELVSIPNATVIGSSVVNFTFSRREIRQPVALATTITIGYDVPWRQVHELMLSAARRVEGISDEIEPFVLQTSLNDFHISYELNAFVRDAGTYRQTLSEVLAALQDVFAAAKVEILSPGYHAIRDGNASTLPPQQE
jgi:small-conductance mechanosensitive channel